MSLSPYIVWKRPAVNYSDSRCARRALEVRQQCHLESCLKLCVSHSSRALPGAQLLAKPAKAVIVLPLVRM